MGVGQHGTSSADMQGSAHSAQPARQPWQRHETVYTYEQQQVQIEYLQSVLESQAEIVQGLRNRLQEAYQEESHARVMKNDRKPELGRKFQDCIEYTVALYP